MQRLRRCLPLFALMLAALSVTHAQTPLRLKNVTPCRLVDTRQQNSGHGFQGTMTFNLQSSAASGGAYGTCTPFSLTSAQAYSLNVTLVPVSGPVGYLTIWPTGESQPLVSLMNSDGRVKANAAIVPAGTPNGEVNVFVTNTTNVLIDIDAYFDGASDTTALAFFPLTPCRIVDTRGGDGGLLPAGQTRSYTIPPSCSVPSNAQAYSFNVTVLPSAGGLDYLTVWPEGETMPVVSTLNAGTSDPAVANAVIVPAGSSNGTSFYPHNNSTNLLLDVNGYFAPANSASNPLSLFTLTPCRLLDTRSGIGLFNGTIPVGIVGGPCGVPGASPEGFVLNATVVPGTPPAGYLTLWPEGETQPVVSTLNAYDGAITSNMAIVPAGSGNDSINAFADNSNPAATTQLILDISSYFGPIPGVSVLSTTLPDGTQTFGYSYQLVATGGLAPYTWSVTSGSPPPGITLASNGLLSGTASTAGTYTFSVKATDSAGNNSSPAALSLTINTSAGTPNITSPGQFNGTLNTPFNVLLTANGGFTPYTWSVVTGSLPSGLSLNASTGLISGVPGATGLTNLVVQVEDSQNNTSRQDLVVVVNTGAANGTLNGMYAGSFRGWMNNGEFFVAAFSLTADGNGNITGGELDTNNPSAGFQHVTITSGTYSIDANGLGQINWTLSGGAGNVSVLVSTGAAEGMRIIGYTLSGSQSWGAGALRQQNPTTFNDTAQAGTWVFGYQGFDSMLRPLSGDGVFTVTSNGNVTGAEDINDDGTHSQTTFTGMTTSSFDPNGRVTLQYDVVGVGTVHLAVYAITASETVAIEIDSGGALYVINSLRQSGGSFGQGSFNGSAVGLGSRIHDGDQNQALVVLAASSGNGNISFTEDINSGGVITLNDLGTGTYQITSNGRADITFTDESQVICYLVATNEAFCINAIPAPGSNDHGAQVIFLEPQVIPSGGFSAASFSGQYLGGSLPQYYSTETGVYTQVDTNVSSGANTFQSTYSQCGVSSCPNLNQTLSATYNNINENTGAFEISESGNPVYAGFMVSTNKVEYITAGSGSIPVALIEVTSSAP